MREEFNAKLESIEARMDGRVARIEALIESQFVRMAEREKHYDFRFAALEEGSKNTVLAIANLKSTTIITAISTVLAIVLGVAAFNATVLSNMVASYESGKSTATTISHAADQLKQTQEQLRKLEEKLVQQAADKK